MAVKGTGPEMWVVATPSSRSRHLTEMSLGLSSAVWYLPCRVNSSAYVTEYMLCLGEMTQNKHPQIALRDLSHY